MIKCSYIIVERIVSVLKKLLSIVLGTTTALCGSGMVNLSHATNSDESVLISEEKKYSDKVAEKDNDVVKKTGEKLDVPSENEELTEEDKTEAESEEKSDEEDKAEAESEKESEEEDKTEAESEEESDEDYDDEYETDESVTDRPSNPIFNIDPKGVKNVLENPFSIIIRTWGWRIVGNIISLIPGVHYPAIIRLGAAIFGLVTSVFSLYVDGCGK